MSKPLTDEEKLFVDELVKEGLTAFPPNHSYRTGFIERRLRMFRFRKCLYEGKELKSELKEKLMATEFKIVVVEFHTNIRIYSKSKFADEQLAQIIKETQIPIEYLTFQTIDTPEWDKMPKFEYKHLEG